MKRLAAVILLLAVPALAAWAARDDASSGSAKLKVSAAAYHVGQPVQFSITNTGANALMLPDPAPWEMWRQSKGGVWQLAYKPLPPAVLVYIDPGQTRDWSWDQKDENRQALETGRYELRFPYLGLTHRFNIVP